MVESTGTSRRGRLRAASISICLLAILAVGGAFRFYNVNWDKGTYHIHPDERHTTMVITDIGWPSSLAEYFDTSHSPLNPRNVGKVYFYGSVPLFLTKLVATELDRFLTSYAQARPSLAEWAETRPHLTDYDQIHLVGRVLSALFDLGSVLLLFFVARRLFGWRVGLVSSFLLALTALNIQGSHYFAVDTFLAFFVLLTMWYTLDVAEGKGWRSFVGLGVSMGLTLACKVSVFLLIFVVALGALVRLRRASPADRESDRAFWIEVLALGLITLAVAARLALIWRVGLLLLASAVIVLLWLGGWTGAAIRCPRRTVVGAIAGLLLASAVTFGVFRVAQPYAWAGPNYSAWESIPEPDRAAYQKSLAIFDRLPNWVGAVFMPNPRWLADIGEAQLQQTGEADMPWGRQWTGRTAWIYPLWNTVVWGMGLPLGVAAWIGVALAMFQMLRTWRRRISVRDDRSSVSASPSTTSDTSLPTIGHQQPANSRHPAQSEFGSPGGWDLALIPLAWVLLVFVWQGAQFVKSVRYYLPLYPFLACFAAYLVVWVWDRARRRRGWARVGAGALAATVLLGTLAWAFAFIQIYRQPLTRVQATQWMYDNIPPGAAIATEHFDDPLPFNMFGRIAYLPAGLYEGVELTLYDEDTRDKLEKLLDDLDRVDYIAMSSGRLFTSIPRLPMRYPVTTRYYQLLFAGKLGFEKAAEFHSYPRLFGIEFNDDGAEEQFTVYDHPKVLIYRKTADYDRERVRAMLSAGIDWDSIAHWLNPRDVSKWKNGLMLTEAQRQVQQQGGTWSSLFDWSSLFNRLPTLWWLILLALLGVVTLPLTTAAFRRLPDRGYILARPVGVLLLAWLSWMLTNLTPLHYTRGTIGLAFGLIALASLGSLLLPGQRERLHTLWRDEKRLILANELLFLAFFAAFWLIRWGNPDLWHPYKGGEKPMDFAYLNAVIKSTEFPPYDPWFAGGYLNYYYFGQVMVGTLIKLIGIVPEVAYNLVIPSWFAMTAMGAFSVVYNMLKSSEKHDESKGMSITRLVRLRPYLFGLLGALFVTVLGNLGEAQLLADKAGSGVLPSFKSTIPGLAGLVRTLVGGFQTIFQGRALPIAIDDWYWDASRAIPSGPGESVITEFPFFTFLYADLHAHLIAMPLTFVSLSAALAVVRERASQEIHWNGVVHTLGLVFMWALTIGAMRTTNTWDVPPHLILAFGALVIGVLASQGRLTWKGVASVAWKFGLLFLLAWSLLYRPFWADYAAYYNRLGVWQGTRTPVWAYLVVHGLFLFAIVSYLAVRALGRTAGQKRSPVLRRAGLTLRYWRSSDRLRRAARVVRVQGLPVSWLMWVGLAILLTLEVAFLIPGLLPFTRPSAAALEAGGYAYRGLSVFALGLPIALLGLLLLLRPCVSPTERFWAWLVLLGLAMSMGVEVLVLEGDIARMNTVFKFYLQVWLMWGVAAAVALAWIRPHVRSWRRGRVLWTAVLAVLILCAALYPPLAAAAKVRDRFDSKPGPGGLDGWAYMKTAHYFDNGQEYDLKWDYQAIRWLLVHVRGSPVILEGHAPEYRWGARYAINTGLPTVLGWNWHQRQQRGVAGDQQVWDRAADVATIYTSQVQSQAEELLSKYQVEYIVVGPLEKVYYGTAGLPKFDTMVAEGKLRVAYQNEEVTLYQIDSLHSAQASW